MQMVEYYIIFVSYTSKVQCIQGNVYHYLWLEQSDMLKLSTTTQENAFSSILA